MIRISEHLSYLSIPYEYLNSQLTLQVIEYKAYELSRYRQEVGYSGKVQIQAPPSLLLPIVNEILDELGLITRQGINTKVGLRYKFMHFMLWSPPQPAMCAMLLAEDRIGYTVLNPKCHFVYLNCLPQKAIDFQI